MTEYVNNFIEDLDLPDGIKDELLSLEGQREFDVVNGSFDSPFENRMIELLREHLPGSAAGLKNAIDLEKRDEVNANLELETAGDQGLTGAFKSAKGPNDLKELQDMAGQLQAEDPDAGPKEPPVPQDKPNPAP